jgi:hypothetical protein
MGGIKFTDNILMQEEGEEDGAAEEDYGEEISPKKK